MSLDLSFHAVRETEVGDFNITHNLGQMAEEAGIYDILWHPEKGVSTAKDMIEPLQKGIADMRARPEHYKQFDSPNGWGKYDDFLPWVDRVLKCCQANPDAKVSASM